MAKIRRQKNYEALFEFLSLYAGVVFRWSFPMFPLMIFSSTPPCAGCAPEVPILPVPLIQ